MVANYKRLLSLPQAGKTTFFLWGARQTGKSTLLRATYPKCKWIDLLRADVFRRYNDRPELLRHELELVPASMVVIDEIQKVPTLLDEVHGLHESMGVQFALCGSSARKLKRGHGNLLGGRAISHALFGFSAAELGDDFQLARILNHGMLPRIYSSDHPQPLLSAYVGEYLKEEVMAEGLVRHLPPFSSFLNMAALGDTEQINFTNFARELGVSRETVRAYFDILCDTLVATLLPAYRKRPKRRLSVADKFYFHDVGVVNFLAKRKGLQSGSELWGKAFESWVFHELRTYNSYRERFASFSFWRLSSGIEVDFVVDDLACLIECKSSRNVRDSHLQGLREIVKDHPHAGPRYIVSCEAVSRKTPDGIIILSVEDFIHKLWGGEIF